MKIGMISLGCDKNRVDSENMLYLIKNAGFTVCGEADEAEIIIINTCAFIESAKKESIEAILDAARLKDRSLKKLVVTGCFAQRYGKIAQMPEVDLFLDIKEEKNIVGHLLQLSGEREQAQLCGKETGRVLTTPPHYAYLKIAEGCDKRCSYCAIPAIRGGYVSRPIEEILAEARELAAGGAKELILVAQDTTAYGNDLYGERRLADLLIQLAQLPVWKIRLLYAYPEYIDDRLLEVIAKEEKIAKYIDIPFQHVDDGVLRLMRRPGGIVKITELIAKIRLKCPGIAIRSTFITGFPGESEQAHESLAAFALEHLDYAGFFVFSPEEGTHAYSLPDRVPKRIANKRKTELEKAQCHATANWQKERAGQTAEVIYEGIDYSKQMFFGRTEYQSPEIDTKVFFTSGYPLEIGQVYKVYITEAGFHLKGHTV